MPLTEADVRCVFDGILEPKLKWNINTLNLLQSIKISAEQAQVKVNLITNDPRW